MIRNLTDLLGYFGESSTGDTEADARVLDRRVYKHTECGAWARLVPPGRRKVGTTPETWTAEIVEGPEGPRCLRVQLGEGACIPSPEAPVHVQEYLLLDPTIPIPTSTDPTLMRLCSWEQLRNMPTGPQMQVTDRDGTLTITFQLDAPVFEPHEGGVLIGSIVEGSDAEVPPEELLFPFSEEGLEHAIQEIEDFADELWQEANGDDAASA